MDLTPLISFDFVIRNRRNQVLLGKRVNAPAKGYWFVPGGRVLKGESIASAFLRLTRVELGVGYRLAVARYLGLYEHFYPDSIFGDGVSTHYLVNAFEWTIDDRLDALPAAQHEAYRWWDEAALLDARDVHDNTKAYLDPSAALTTAQAETWAL